LLYECLCNMLAAEKYFCHLLCPGVCRLVLDCQLQQPHPASPQQQQKQQPRPAQQQQSLQQDRQQQQQQVVQQQQQQLVRQAQQLEEWLHELRCMVSAAAAAALQIVHDPCCSPQLLINAAMAQQHPLWAADYATWQQQQQQQRDGQNQSSSRQSTPSQSNSQSNIPQLQVLLPSVAQLDICGNAALPVAAYYAAAVQGAPAIRQLRSSSAQQHTSNVTSNSPQQQPNTAAAYPAAVGQQGSESDSFSWPLTAAATAALLASPPGLLREWQLQAVYDLGLGARLQALAAAIDLGQMLRQEVHSTEVSKR
jgi:hypothetical protein